ncbi:hypothetical protein DL96DRAFT_1277722 [Flagelloscypha sp. PMI_526]|nr:hypothetical protein DL96DRAFT_1277722 [Flagelloscypha sp. PMI_526]
MSRRNQNVRAFYFHCPMKSWSSSARQVWVGFYSLLEREVLAKCINITDLAVTHRSHGMLNLTIYANLRRLVLDHSTAEDFFNQLANIYQNNVIPALTHLQVTRWRNLSPDATWIPDFQLAIPQLPVLSHVMLEYKISWKHADWESLRTVVALSQMKRIVILKCPQSGSFYQQQQPLEPLLIEHPKVVVLDWEPRSLRQDWDKSCFGGVDTWDMAEEVAQKQLKVN